MSWWLRTIEQPTTLVLVILLAHFVAKRPELLGVKSNWSSAQEPLPLLFQLLSEPLPRSSAYDSLYNGLAARKQRQCILPGDSHALHDLFGRQQLLSSCEAEEYFGLWHRLVSSVQQAWFQLSQRWRPWLTEEIVVEVLNQQRHFANLGLAALELQPATHADPLAKAVWSINNHSRPEAQVAKELQISVEAVSWLRTYGSEIAEAVDDIFTAQVLGLQQSKWLRNHKDKWNDVLGEVGGFLFGRFRGRPHPVLLHQSAEAITALMQSIWIDEKNMADQSAELEEQVERATDSGSLPDLLMKTAVDESWVLQLQSLSLGLPWLPDLPAYSGVDEAGTTHEELSRILSGKGSLSAKLLSPLQILQRNDSEASGWTSVLLSEWYPSPVVKLQEILAAGHMVNPRLAEVAQAIYQGDVGPLCRAVSDAVFDQNTTPQVFLSLCPTATEARDLWKEPLALVLGVAQRLPQHLFLGLRDLQTVLRSLWESAGKRLSVPFTPENLAETGCNSSVISVWPLRLAGAARMMQDPHILQYSTGSAALVMDTILLKCKGKWSNASMTLGGPRVLSDEACVRSILAAHVAWREGPQRLSMVGRVQPIVGVTNEELWDALSPSWRQLALQPVASAQPAIAAFGAWWPVLRLLWADAGAVLGCGRSNVGKKKSGLEAELCLWAILGRLADELRPWEDFVGSDSPVLLSATFLLGWFAMKQVIYCSDWEDENTGEIHCDCGLPIGSASESNGATMPLLKPSALPAAESLLELLSEIVIAGEAANVQLPIAGPTGFEFAKPCPKALGESELSSTVRGRNFVGSGGSLSRIDLGQYRQ